MFSQFSFLFSFHLLFSLHASPMKNLLALGYCTTLTIGQHSTSVQCAKKKIWRKNWVCIVDVLWRSLNLFFSLVSLSSLLFPISNWFQSNLWEMFTVHSVVSCSGVKIITSMKGRSRSNEQKATIKATWDDKFLTFCEDHR